MIWFDFCFALGGPASTLAALRNALLLGKQTKSQQDGNTGNLYFVILYQFKCIECATADPASQAVVYRDAGRGGDELGAHQLHQGVRERTRRRPPLRRERKGG